MVTWGAFSAVVVGLLLLGLIAGLAVKVARRRRVSRLS
jgi:hypothetical protein